jgi:hypothetical protein
MGHRRQDARVGDRLRRLGFRVIIHNKYCTTLIVHLIWSASALRSVVSYYEAADSR